jgi:hypothetical protein
MFTVFMSCASVWALLFAILFMVISPSLAQDEYEKTRERWPHAKALRMLYFLLMEGMGSAMLLLGTALLIGNIWGLQTPAQDTSQLFPGGSLGLLLTEVGLGLMALNLVVAVSFASLYIYESRRWPLRRSRQARTDEQ